METILKIQNDFSFLKTENQEIMNFLWEKLRFRKRNYFHDRLYKQKLWDGYVNFFSKETGKFLTGLLPEVKLALKFKNIQYQEVIKKEPPVEFSTTSIDNQYLNYLPNKEFILEDYQVEFVNQCLKHKRGIAESPCGSGKSAICISIIKAIKEGTPILFLCNRVGLMNQMYKDLNKWGIKNVGRLGSKYKENDTIMCAMVQSLHHMQDDLEKFKVLIVDEAHTMTNTTCIKAYKKLKNAQMRIGLSATAFKFNETDLKQKFTLKGYIGPMLKIKCTESGMLTTQELIERGRLSKAVCNFYPINEPDIQYDTYMDAIANGIEHNFYFHQVVQRLVSTLKGRTLILVGRVQHGDYLKQLIPHAQWIYGKDKEEARQRVVDSLQKDENAVAIATYQIFGTGINVFIHNLVNCTSIQAGHEIKQVFGRLIRTAEDKTTSNYYDFLFKINQYLEKHSKERIKVLKKEKHEIIVHEKIDF